MVECPVCYAPIDEDEFELDEGQTLICDRCGTGLVVASLSPLEFEEVEEEFDDFDGMNIDEDDPLGVASL